MSYRLERDLGSGYSSLHGPLPAAAAVQQAVSQLHTARCNTSLPNVNSVLS